MAPPRLHFHASLRESILDGRKTATTRLRGEADANSDLEALRAGVRCSARTGAGGAADAFADLEVRRVATSRFADLDDDVARLEGCADAEALRRLIARFYPAAVADTEFVVYHFVVVADGDAPRVPWALGAAVAGVQALGKSGDALGVALVDSHPLVLLALNANDVHCALTGSRLPLARWFAVAFLRRTAEDPVFYYLGRRYGDVGVAWLRDRGVSDAALRLCRRASAAAVLVEPNALVCALAGAARMRPATFALLNACGTALRLVALRWVSARPEVEAVLAFVRRGRGPLLALALAAVAGPALLARRRARRAKAT